MRRDSKRGGEARGRMGEAYARGHTQTSARSNRHPERLPDATITVLKQVMDNGDSTKLHFNVFA